MSRYHFLLGVMAYLASPTWLVFLVLGTIQIPGAQDVLHTIDILRPIPLPIPRTADPRILIGLPLLLLLLPRFFGVRKSVVEGKGVFVRVDIGGRRIIKQK